MAKCQVCSKGPMFGHNRSHALNATRKVFQPNIQRRRLVLNGVEQRVKVCTRCIRTLEKHNKFKPAV